MPDQTKTVVTNLAAGPRAFSRRTGPESVEPVTLAPGESAEIEVAFPDNPVYRAWLESGEIKEGLSEEEQEQVATHAANYTAALAGQLPGNVQPHPVAIQNHQALTNTPGPFKGAPVTQQPLVIPQELPPRPPGDLPPSVGFVNHPAMASALKPNVAQPNEGASKTNEGASKNGSKAAAPPPPPPPPPPPQG